MNSARDNDNGHMGHTGKSERSQRSASMDTDGTKKIDQSSADLVELEDPKVPRVMVENIVSQKINILLSTTWVRIVGRRIVSFPSCSK